MVASCTVAFAAAPDAGTGGEVVQPGVDISQLSLDELLAAPVEVASLRQETTREAAAVVTVFNREEIVASGARDLSDLLWLVPGFTQNVDVQNVVGLGVRGIWSYEGKVLLMVDGIDMTEQLYGTNQLGLHYLTSNIERLEIIRGPGSAVYGGNAGMAVISIITRGAKAFDGAEVDLRYAQGPRTFADRSVGFNVAHTLDVGGGVGVSLSGYLGQGNRSDGVYVDPSGQKWDLSDHRGAATDPMNANLSVSWKGLKARLLFDRYTVSGVDGFGPLTTTTRDGMDVPNPALQRFQTLAADLRYRFALSDSVSIEPRLLYRHQLPWWAPDPNGSLYYDKSTQRLLAGVQLEWAASAKVHLLGGVEAFYDLAKVEGDVSLVGSGIQTDFSLISNDPNQADLWNLAAYAQLQWDHPIANLTLGGRAEYHSVAGASVVPRLAATKSVDRLTAKLLFSGAFRAPSFENLNASPDGKLDPERIWVGEFELGYQPLDWAFVSLNGFLIDVDHPIVYSADPVTDTEAYRNSGHVGSRGAELELQLRGSPGFLRMTYSFSEASANTTVPNFLQVDGTTTWLVGMPGHKLTLFGHLALPRSFSLNTTALVVGTRKGSDANGLEVTYAPALIINANVRWEAPAPVKGLWASLGVDNVLDDSLPVVQAYNGGHPPLPGRSRDFFLRLGYSFTARNPE